MLTTKAIEEPSSFLSEYTPPRAFLHLLREFALPWPMDDILLELRLPQTLIRLRSDTTITRMCYIVGDHYKKREISQKRGKMRTLPDRSQLDKEVDLDRTTPLIWWKEGKRSFFSPDVCRPRLG